MQSFEEILIKMQDLCYVKKGNNSFKKISDQTDVIIYQFAYINKQACQILSKFFLKCRRN